MSHSHSSGSSSDSSSGSDITSTMVPYLHFAGGDNLFFYAWRPTSAGALAGAAIGLFALALLERWISAQRNVMEAYWRRRALALESTRLERQTTTTDKPQDALPRPRAFLRTIPPFILSHDVSRGVIHAVQVLLSYLLMLAVMTFQGAYIIAIVAGLGVGETLFGRIGSNQHSH